MQRFRGGLVLRPIDFVYHSTLVLGVIKKKGRVFPVVSLSPSLSMISPGVRAGIPRSDTLSPDTTSSTPDTTS